MSRHRAAWFLILLTMVVVFGHGASFAAGGDEAAPLGARLSFWWVLPFVGILLSIALFPLFAPHFWHHHYPKVTAFWTVLVAAPLIAVFGDEGIREILAVFFIDYISFIILLWSLFTVAGGIHVMGTPNGTPKFNTVLLGIGTVVASWVGTTGAAMILIRTVLRANAWRKRRAHVICFFIFLVCNIGGALTPLGDPPLFLGFLHGVPFFWTMKLLPHMLLVSVPLLAFFFVLDSYHYRKEEKPKTTHREPLRIEGLHNLFFIAGIVGAVLLSGFWNPGSVRVFGVEKHIQALARDGILVLMGLGSLVTTKKQIRIGNEFTWGPIKEVAILFAGIFATIVPPIAILLAGEKGPLAVLMNPLEAPAHYYWITGSLSSFLDNAPSYLTFFNSLLGRFFAGVSAHEAVQGLITEKTVYLEGVAAAAVFFGANTYIGNAPNFMVKSIAEESGVKMPSFFGYMFKYSIPMLLPLFALVALVFF